MLNTLHLGQSILSIRATDTVSASSLTAISSFEIPAKIKIAFRVAVICLFYKTSDSRLKVILLEVRRGRNTCSTYEALNGRRLEVCIEELNGDVPLLVEFSGTCGYETTEDFIRIILSAALCNMPINDLRALLSHCRLN